MCLTRSVAAAVPSLPERQTNRICHTIELDEKYCDVIVKRYIEQVGTAENVSVVRNGKTICFDDLEVPADGE